ncbi:MAG TPA: ABC transporter ATP-binding protein [Humisphaera sp.]
MSKPDRTDLPPLAAVAGSPIVRATGLHKTFRMGESDVTVLKNATLTVRAGEFVAIEGRSGSGKSTLLHILGALDEPDGGTVEYFGGGSGRPGGEPAGAAGPLALLVGLAFCGLLVIAASVLLFGPPLVLLLTPGGAYGAALAATGGLLVVLAAGWLLSPVINAAADRASLSLSRDKQSGRRPTWRRINDAFSGRWAIALWALFAAVVGGTWLAYVVQLPQGYEVAAYAARTLPANKREAVEAALHRSAATHALAMTLLVWLGVTTVLLLFAVAFRLTVAWLDDRLAARSRNNEFGFVFQFYHLLPELTVLENTMLGQMVRNGPVGFLRRRGTIRDRARQVLEQLGMGHRLTHRPAQLSGGERQRVAIARALMNDPRILFADEPTGNLDADTGRQIMDVIEGLHRDRGQTIVMVTHDRALAREADRVLVLKDGRLEKADG